MAARIVNLPTPEQLRELLRYEPNTGKLFWKERPLSMFSTGRHCNVWNARYRDKEAFTATDEGYKQGTIFYKRYKAHRVAWAIHYGEWPNGQIDHVNRNRSDNRIVNMRIATNAQNQWNVAVRKESAIGFKGVVKSRGGNGWYARISVNGVRKNLGYFFDPEDAHAAYCKAAKKYHGEFSRTE